MLWIAHRGYSIDFRDNSVEAIREAVRRGYHGVEIDVQLCKTGEIVLHHDVYYGDAFVKDMTLDQLDELGVVSLHDVYDEVPELEHTMVLLDIKGGDHAIIEALRMFYIHRSTRLVTFCSFNRGILFNLPYGFMRGSTFETTFNVDEYDVITRGLSAVVVHWTCLSHTFITHCRMKDIRVYTYTHKETMELEYMYKYNVDGIITNGGIPTSLLQKS
jgi:glycerophosphoryl diester phosphodiesterase